MALQEEKQFRKTAVRKKQSFYLPSFQWRAAKESENLFFIFSKKNEKTMTESSLVPNFRVFSVPISDTQKPFQQH